jgi:hypothetical protein
LPFSRDGRPHGQEINVKIKSAFFTLDSAVLTYAIYAEFGAVGAVADPGVAFGGQIERRRRENRGAVGAEGGGVWGGGVPLPWGGAEPLPRKFFDFFVKNEAFWYIVKANRDVILTTKTVIVDLGFCDKIKQ